MEKIQHSFIRIGPHRHPTHTSGSLTYQLKPVANIIQAGVVEVWCPGFVELGYKCNKLRVHAVK